MAKTAGLLSVCSGESPTLRLRRYGTLDRDGRVGAGTCLADSPDHGAVHGARRLGEDRAMMCGRESHGATAKATRGRLAHGIPLIPLNPGESRFRINDSRNPVSVSGCDASRPGHSLAPSCPDSFRASTALRRARLMEMAGYPDTRNESGQVRAGPGMTRELRARVGSRVDARIPGTSPGMTKRGVGRERGEGRRR